jgi:hypothetical protein
MNISAFIGVSLVLAMALVALAVTYASDRREAEVSGRRDEPQL